MNVLLAIVVTWLVVVGLSYGVVLPLLRRGPDRDALNGLMWIAIRVLARLVHRARFEGHEALRMNVDPGPLIVVSNHTGSIDPLLIQAACRFHVRWMMAEELMFPELKRLWERQRLIPVSRDGTDRASAREAIRHVKAGGVVGIFPEGRIVTPPRQVWPFFAGVGLVISRTRAPALLVWVSGTPETNDVTRSIFTSSRARVVFVDLIRFEDSLGAAEITDALRARIQAVSGWPLNDDPPPVATTTGAADGAAALAPGGGPPEMAASSR
ncbi:MAG: lysophospholipid acyltransferase family protein [Planctomycetota bacterium]|jgi:1-acyl-sn-glycerol-3-phosphate acyltransferase